MGTQVNYIELVERAQRGDRESLNGLAEIARERLRVYVYRLTLQEDLTQDIVQESLFEMCRVLGKLRQTDRFWSWLYGIATNKLHRHHRTERAMRKAAASEERRRGPMKERQGGLENLVGQELRQIVSSAMQKLRTRHKAVLVMRCYDGMSYAEIAESMGCSEFSTRMLFMRAKRALQKELSRNGFGKGSLLAALVLFGKITAPSKAAAAELTVPIAAMKVGALASVMGLAATKTAVISVTAAGALTVGTLVATSPPKSDVTGGPGNAPAAVATVTSPLAAATGTGRKSYYYFPDRPGGPLMLRAESNTGAGRPAGRVLQNAESNYSYKGNTVYINNHRAWQEDLSVFKLPTDSRDLRLFLSQVEGVRPGPELVSARGRNLLVVVERDDDEAPEDSRPWAVRHENVLEEDYFQSDWPTDARVVDNRDAMHARGWTYFRIRGRVNDKQVTGLGRIPFVYATARRYNAWLKLSIAGDVTVIDSDASAQIVDANGAIVRRYPRGSFFRGLARPWEGLHSMDTVRRDAAGRRVWFDTALTADGRQVEVTVTHGQTKLVYTIDLEADLVEKIAFFVGSDSVGYLEFEYLQDIDAVRSEFMAPSARSSRTSLNESKGILWLIRLARGDLDN